jgi:hypothetical protein
LDKSLASLYDVHGLSYLLLLFDDRMIAQPALFRQPPTSPTHFETESNSDVHFHTDLLQRTLEAHRQTPVAAFLLRR